MFLFKKKSKLIYCIGEVWGKRLESDTSPEKQKHLHILIKNQESNTWSGFAASTFKRYSNPLLHTNCIDNKSDCIDNKSDCVDNKSSDNYQGFVYGRNIDVNSIKIIRQLSEDVGFHKISLLHNSALRQGILCVFDNDPKLVPVNKQEFFKNKKIIVLKKEVALQNSDLFKRIYKKDLNNHLNIYEESEFDQFITSENLTYSPVFNNFFTKPNFYFNEVQKKMDFRRRTRVSSFKRRYVFVWVYFWSFFKTLID